MTVTLVAGGTVALPGGRAADADVLVVDGRITAVEPGLGSNTRNDVEVLDASGRFVAPGFVDVQINGGWGHDFTAEPTSIGDVARRLPATGVTAFLPTVVTSAAPARAAALDAWRDTAGISGGVADADVAAPIGLHFEGPMISPDRRGAHDPRYIASPTDVDIAGWAPDTGVWMVTIAPELAGATGVIRELVSRGVTVAIGHTACTAGQFAAAVEAGASMVTHLFNAMGPFDHREPGSIGATLGGSRAGGGVAASVICDGIHVDPTAVRMARRALGPERFVLVTDAMAALGLEGSSAALATLTVTIDETGVRTADGVLAGSNLALDQAVRNAVEFGACTPLEAIRAATENPSAVLGLTDRGRVEVGARGDLVLLDSDLNVTRTLIDGRTVWKS